MKSHLLYISLLFLASDSFAQRICCTFLDIIAPSCETQVIVDASPAGYYAFRGESGCTYLFSHCNEGGSFSGDPYLTISDDDCNEIAWNDDFCGLGSQLTWTCSETGMYAIHMGTFNAGCTPLARSLAFRITDPTPSISIATPSPICLGESIQLQASTDEEEVYWSPLTGLSCSNCPNPIASPTQTTTYTASVSSGCCAAVAVVTVIVKPIYNVSVTQNICEGESIDFGDQTLFIPGEYSHTFTSKTGCDSTVVLTLGLETVSADVEIFGGVITTNQPGATYQWFDCDNGLEIPGANNQFFVPSVSGQYGVNVITPNGCMATSDCGTVTGVADQESSEQWIVFPNPSNGSAFIQARVPSTFRLFDSTGRMLEVIDKRMNSTIEIPRLAAGSYVILEEETGVAKRLQVIR